MDTEILKPFLKHSWWKVIEVMFIVQMGVAWTLIKKFPSKIQIINFTKLRIVPSALDVFRLISKQQNMKSEQGLIPDKIKWQTGRGLDAY